VYLTAHMNRVKCWGANHIITRQAHHSATLHSTAAFTPMASVMSQCLTSVTVCTYVCAVCSHAEEHHILPQPGASCNAFAATVCIYVCAVCSHAEEDHVLPQPGDSSNAFVATVCIYACAVCSHAEEHHILPQPGDSSNAFVATVCLDVCSL